MASLLAVEADIHCNHAAQSLARSFDQRLVGQALVVDGRQEHLKPAQVRICPSVVGKHPLIHVAKQVVGIDADVRPVEASLQEGPEVLDPVRVNLTDGVGLGVVDHVVDILGIQSAIGTQASV